MKTLANDLIGRLDAEQPSRRKRFVQKQGTLDKILKAYERAYKSYRRANNLGNWDLRLSSELPYAKEAVSKIKLILPEDVQATYDFLKMNEDSEMFYTAFLGELCKQCTGKSVLALGKEKLRYFGNAISLNDKVVTLIGDVNDLGNSMRSGTLILAGSADVAGRYLRSGAKIIIEGNADEVGHKLLGGTIFVNGTAKNIACEAESGRIYINNKLVYDREP